MANHIRRKQHNEPIYVTGAKRGKTSASKSRLVLVLRLNCWEIHGACIANQSQNVVKQNQSKREIIFDTLKTALSSHPINI